MKNHFMQVPVKYITAKTQFFVRIDKIGSIITTAQANLFHKWTPKQVFVTFALLNCYTHLFVTCQPYQLPPTK